MDEFSQQIYSKMAKEKAMRLLTLLVLIPGTMLIADQELPTPQVNVNLTINVEQQPQPENAVPQQSPREILEQFATQLTGLVDSVVTLGDCTKEHCMELDAALTPVMEHIYAATRYEAAVRQIAQKHNIDLENLDKDLKGQRIVVWIGLQIFYFVHETFKNAFREAIIAVAKKHNKPAEEVAFAAEKLNLYVNRLIVKMQKKAVSPL